MKGLIWNCKSVQCSHEKGVTNSEDCLLVYICCEVGDTHNDVKEAARRITQLNKKRFHREKIVIFPFAHMSNHIMDIDEAHQMIKKIASSISVHTRVHILGFNKKKEIKIHLLPENTDVSFFSY